jgi:hypothetical protein
MDLKLIAEVAVNKYQEGKKYFSELFSKAQIPKCSTGYISGACKGGHKFAAPFLCGKDYCKECGRDGSPIHQRRVSRWSSLVDQYTSLGYLVFTFPKEVRFLFLDKAILSDFRYQLKRKLIRDGFKKGLMRWHWFGDCKSCNGYGCFYCDETGSGQEFHPHLNIFIDKKYIANLDLFLATYKRWVKMYVNRLLDKEIKKRVILIEKYGDVIGKSDKSWKELDLLNDIQSKFTAGDIVINYSYTKKKSIMIHKLKYVTRSTFRIYNKDVKESLHNYRNSVRWGFTKVKSCLNPIHCDICKSKGFDNIVHWHKLNNYTNPLKVKHYENGIYRISEGSYHDSKPLTLTPTRIRMLTARDFSELPNSHYSSKHSSVQ